MLIGAKRGSQQPSRESGTAQRRRSVRFPGSLSRWKIAYRELVWIHSTSCALVSRWSRVRRDGRSSPVAPKCAAAQCLCCEWVRMTDEQHQWIWTEQGVDAQGIRRPDDKWLLKLPSEHEDLWSALIERAGAWKEASASWTDQAARWLRRGPPLRRTRGSRLCGRAIRIGPAPPDRNVRSVTRRPRAVPGSVRPAAR